MQSTRHGRHAFCGGPSSDRDDLAVVLQNDIEYLGLDEAERDLAAAPEAGVDAAVVVETCERTV
jgi:hypothetical protein